MSTASDSQSGQRTDTESGPGEGPPTGGDKGSGGQPGPSTLPPGQTSFRRCVLVSHISPFYSIWRGEAKMELVEELRES